MRLEVNKPALYRRKPWSFRYVKIEPRLKIEGSKVRTDYKVTVNNEYEDYVEVPGSVLKKLHQELANNIDEIVCGDSSFAAPDVFRCSLQLGSHPWVKLTLLEMLDELFPPEAPVHVEGPYR